jgi:hypothetical protein
MTGKRKALAALDSNRLGALPRFPSDSELSSSNWARYTVESSKTPKTSNRGGQVETASAIEARKSFATEKSSEEKLQTATTKQGNVATRKGTSMKVDVSGSRDFSWEWTDQDFQNDDTLNPKQKTAVQKQLFAKPPMKQRTSAAPGLSRDVTISTKNKTCAASTNNEVGQLYLSQGSSKSLEDSQSDTESESLCFPRSGRSPEQFQKKPRGYEQALASPPAHVQQSKATKDMKQVSTTTTPSLPTSFHVAKKETSQGRAGGNELNSACGQHTILTTSTPSRSMQGPCPRSFRDAGIGTSDGQAGGNHENMDCEPDTASFGASLCRSLPFQDVGTRTSALLPGTEAESMDCEPDTSSFDTSLGMLSTPPAHPTAIDRFCCSLTPEVDGGGQNIEIAFDTTKKENTSVVPDEQKEIGSEIGKSGVVSLKSEVRESFRELMSCVVVAGVEREERGSNVEASASGRLLSDEEHRRATTSAFHPASTFETGVVRSGIRQEEDRPIVTRGMMERALNRPSDNEQLMRAMIGSEPRKLGSNGINFVGCIVGGRELQQAHSLDESDVTTCTRSTMPARDIGQIFAFEKGKAATNVTSRQRPQIGRQPDASKQNSKLYSTEKAGLQGQARISDLRQGHSSDESSIVPWSIDDGSASIPIEFTIAGKRFSHPPLPPGWRIRVSDKQNRPYYTHPDFGTTWHCPIVLLPREVNQELPGDEAVPRAKGQITADTTHWQEDLERNEPIESHFGTTPSESKGGVSETMSEVVLQYFVTSSSENRTTSKFPSPIDESPASCFFKVHIEPTVSPYVPSGQPLTIRKSHSKEPSKAQLCKPNHTQHMDDPTHRDSSTLTPAIPLSNPTVHQSTPVPKVQWPMPGRPSKSCTRGVLPSHGQALVTSSVLSPIAENGSSTFVDSEAKRGDMALKHDPTKQNVFGEKQLWNKHLSSVECLRTSTGKNVSPFGLSLRYSSPIFRSVPTQDNRGRLKRLETSANVKSLADIEFQQNQQRRTNTALLLKRRSHDSCSSAADSRSSWISPPTSGERFAIVGVERKESAATKDTNAQLENKSQDANSVADDSQTSQVSPEVPEYRSRSSAFQTHEIVATVCGHRQKRPAWPVLEKGNNFKNTQATQVGASSSPPRSASDDAESPRENVTVGSTVSKTTWESPHASQNIIPPTRSWREKEDASAIHNHVPTTSSLHRESPKWTPETKREGGPPAKARDSMALSHTRQELSKQTEKLQALTRSSNLAGDYVQPRPAPTELRSFLVNRLLGFGKRGVSSPGNPTTPRYPTSIGGGVGLRTTGLHTPLANVDFSKLNDSPQERHSPEIVTESGPGNAVDHTAKQKPPLLDRSTAGKVQNHPVDSTFFVQSPATERSGYVHGSKDMGKRNSPGWSFPLDRSKSPAVRGCPVAGSVSSRNDAIPDMVTFKSPGLSSIALNSDSSFSDTITGSFEAVTPYSNASGTTSEASRSHPQSSLDSFPQNGSYEDDDSVHISVGASAKASHLHRLVGSPSSSGFFPVEAGLPPNSTILNTPEFVTREESYQLATSGASDCVKLHRDPVLTCGSSISLSEHNLPSFKRALVRRPGRSSRGLMDARVINPPLPLCSLQNLDALQTGKQKRKFKGKKTGRARGGRGF